MERTLRLHHKLLLLALSDDEGTVAFSSMLGLGLGAAIFTELLLEERVAIVDTGSRWNKQLVEVVDPTPFGEEVIDSALARLHALKRRGSPSTTVSRLGNVSGLRHAVARELCRAGVLRETEQQVMLLFRRRTYPTVDKRPEQALIRRIRAVLDGGKPTDPRLAALIAIADASGSLAAIYDRKERRALKPRIKAVTESSAGGKAAREAIAAVQAAIIAATTAAAAAAG